MRWPFRRKPEPLLLPPPPPAQMEVPEDVMRLFRVLDLSFLSLLERVNKMATSAEIQALTAKVDAIVAIVPQLVAENQALKAQVAANADVSANHADDVAAVTAETAKIDPVLTAAQSALGTL